jgi:hypothetical protein
MLGGAVGYGLFFDVGTSAVAATKDVMRIAAMFEQELQRW